jgi:hypothetical protein
VTQFLRPDSNVTQTSFTNGFANIDETPAADADFAFGANNVAAVLEVGLSNPSGTPAAGTTTVRYRIAKTNAGIVDGNGSSVTVTCGVYQGTTLIAADTAKTASGTWTQYSFTPNMSGVTDWTNLRLRFTTSASGGTTANRRGGAVSWAELEAPNAGTTHQGAFAASGAGTFAAAAKRQLAAALAASGAGTFAAAAKRQLVAALAVSGAGSFAGAAVKRAQATFVGVANGSAAFAARGTARAAIAASATGTFAAGASRTTAAAIAAAASASSLFAGRMIARGGADVVGSGQFVASGSVAGNNPPPPASSQVGFGLGIGF